MKKVLKKTAIYLMAFAIAFTALPSITGDIGAHAATPKKPAQVKGVAKKASGTNYITIKWKRIAKNKNAKGYAVYRNGKFIKRVGKNTLEYKHTKLKANTTYKFQVRAYNTYKQKQYYNSKTKKWQVKKPATRNWKGKRTRRITKYAYGLLSAALKIKTAKPAAKKTTGGSTISEPPITYSKFEMIGSAPTELTYSDSQTVFVTIPGTGFSVDWKSSNPSAISAKSNGDSVTLDALKPFGSATITGTLIEPQGSKYSGPKSISFTISKIGVSIRDGIVYASEGVFGIKRGKDRDFVIDNIEINIEDIPQFFPTGSTFSINATEVAKRTESDDGIYSQSGYSIRNNSAKSISDKSVMFYTQLRDIDTSEGGLFFVDSGTSSITYNNGVTHTFIVSGRNEEMYNYRQFVKSFAEENKEKSDWDTTLAAVALCRSFKIGTADNPFSMITSDSSVGGTAHAKAKLLRRLLSECGVNSYFHGATMKDNEGNTANRCVINEMKINGEDYMVDATNSDNIYKWNWGSEKNEYEIEFNASVNKNRNDSINHMSILY